MITTMSIMTKPIFSMMIVNDHDHDDDDHDDDHDDHDDDAHDDDMVCTS